MESKTVQVEGLPVHYLDFGGSGRPMVLVHGLAGAALNWMAVGDGLAAAGYHVTALDLAGFGQTPPDGHKPTIRFNQRLLDGFLERVAGAPAVLVGNSMGGLISLLEAARQPSRVSRLVLVDPAVPVKWPRRLDLALWMSVVFPLAALGGQAYLRHRSRRLGAERVVRAGLELCCTNPDAVPPQSVAAHVQLVREREALPWAEKALIQASRSLFAQFSRGRFGGVIRSVGCPGLVIHGRDDRLVPVATALELGRLRPDWQVVVLDGVGHVPMMEAPDRFLDEIRGWLTRAEAA